MTKKKLIFILLFLLAITYWNRRRITFHFECKTAKKELTEYYHKNEQQFLEFPMFIPENAIGEIYLLSNDSISISFEDSSKVFINDFKRNSFLIGRFEQDSMDRFSVESNGLLKIENQGFIKYVDAWTLYATVHYKDKKIEKLLNHYGWSTNDFETVIQKIKKLNCESISIYRGEFTLGFKFVPYHKHSDLMDCFGPSNGQFDFLYSKKPIEQHYWKKYMNHLSENYYSVAYW